MQKIILIFSALLFKVILSDASKSASNTQNSNKPKLIKRVITILDTEYIKIKSPFIMPASWAVENTIDIGDTHGYILEIPSSTFEAIKKDKHFKYVEDADMEMRICDIQTDAGWNLNRVNLKKAFTTPYNINLFAYTYSYSKKGSDVNVYILDTGIHTTHEEFEGRASVGATFTNDGAGDRNNHGTHVAGIVGGKKYGVAKNVNLIDVKVLNDRGIGSIGSVINGLNWVATQVTNNPQKAIVNLSIVGEISQAINTAVNSLFTLGIIVVAAAGNFNQDACNFSPASASGAMTVGASTATDTKYAFSNYGNCVGIIAPGENIMSAISTSNSSTSIFSGTSMAAPHVSGASAIEWSGTNLTPGRVMYNIITKSFFGVISGFESKWFLHIE